MVSKSYAYIIIMVYSMNMHFIHSQTNIQYFILLYLFIFCNSKQTKITITHTCTINESCRVRCSGTECIILVYEYNIPLSGVSSVYSVIERSCFKTCFLTFPSQLFCLEEIPFHLFNFARKLLIAFLLNLQTSPTSFLA